MNKKIILIKLIILFSIFSFDTHSQEMSKIVAGQGDGIFAILRENGYNPSEYFHIFIELNSEKITENNELIYGETYYLPPKLSAEQLKKTEYIDSLISTLLVHADTLTLKDTISEDSLKEHDYFAEELIEETHTTSEIILRYADSIKDNILEGAVIYLISGHGGPDPGAMATIDGHTISEAVYAYDITLRIAKKIEEHGGIARMIIKSDEYGVRDCRILTMNNNKYCYPNLPIPRDHNQRLRQRVTAVNNLYMEYRDMPYHRLVEVHLDSRSTGTNIDVFFYHYRFSNTGRRFAENIRQVFEEKYSQHQPNRGYKGTVSGRNLFIISNTYPPAVLIELGNIQNSFDQRRFLMHTNRQALANWIVEGIIRDYTSAKQLSHN